jgi:hypothetical protein
VDSFRSAGRRAGAEPVEGSPPGDRRDRPQLGRVEGDLAAERLGVVDHRLAGLARVAGVERRLRVVLDVELDRLGPLPAGDLAGQPEAEVEAGGDAGRGDDLAGGDDPL